MAELIANQLAAGIILGRARELAGAAQIDRAGACARGRFPPAQARRYVGGLVLACGAKPDSDLGAGEGS